MTGNGPSGAHMGTLIIPTTSGLTAPGAKSAANQMDLIEYGCTAGASDVRTVVPGMTFGSLAKRSYDPNFVIPFET